MTRSHRGSLPPSLIGETLRSATWGVAKAGRDQAVADSGDKLHDASITMCARVAARLSWRSSTSKVGPWRLSMRNIRLKLLRSARS
jgi:hypothetical protein